MKIYKTNKKRIIKNIIIIGIIMEIVLIINSGYSFDKLYLDALFLFGIGILYFFVVGYLPLLKILREREILYRSDYGVKHFVNIDKIKKITKGSGLGGFNHALFIVHMDDKGNNRKLTIKSSFFKKEDMVDFVRYIKSKVNIQTNKELEDFIV